MSGFSVSKQARTFAATLLISTSLSTAVLVQPAAAAQSRDAAWDAFQSSRYNYCDAKMLGAVWGFNADRGKIEIGMKILNGIEGNLEPLFEQSRQAGNECGWEDTGLTYEDAVRLAAVWETTPLEAKATAATHYTYGTWGQVRNALGR